MGKFYQEYASKELRKPKEVYVIVKDNKPESVKLTPFMVHYLFIDKKLNRDEFFICDMSHKLKKQWSYGEWAYHNPIDNLLKEQQTFTHP